MDDSLAVADHSAPGLDMRRSSNGQPMIYSGEDPIPVTRLVSHRNTDRVSTHTHTQTHTHTHTHTQTPAHTHTHTDMLCTQILTG